MVKSPPKIDSRTAANVEQKVKELLQYYVPEVLKEYDLKLMSLENTDALPKEGNSLVYVAKVDEFYHLRIFNRVGDQIFGNENSEFLPENELEEKLIAIFQKTGKDPIPVEDNQTKSELISKITSSLGHIQLKRLSEKLGTQKTQGISTALIKIFARYCEIIIERLNKVPEKNFLAFLDLLGASLRPPQPARVPLTFFLSQGSREDIVVPRGNQVAAQLAEGEKDPIVFETEENLVVTAAQISSIYVFDPSHKSGEKNYIDHSKIINSATSETVSISRVDERVYPLEELDLDEAIANQSSVDLSNYFLPFGEEKIPLGRTLYLASSKGFSRKDLTVSLALVFVKEDANTLDERWKTAVQWEFWQGKRWKAFEEVDSDQSEQDNRETSTAEGESTELQEEREIIKLRFSEKPEKTRVNGINNFWIRARIVSGEHNISKTWIKSIKISDYQLGLKNWTDRATYFGFTLPSNRREMLNFPLNLFMGIIQSKYSDASQGKVEKAEYTWQYWQQVNTEQEMDWADLTVVDGTADFSRPGIIKFVPPKDFAPSENFGLSARYWIRIKWEPNDESFNPQVQRMLLNTVMATQAITVRNELLGSSDGSENQRFRTNLSPILQKQESITQGQLLEVHEPVISSNANLGLTGQTKIPEITSPVTDSAERLKENWVSWEEVPDFYGSEPTDRHYVLNHLTGEVQFGDGHNGRVPPIGIRNVRMARYQTGGGSMGNKPAGSITQLKTTVPYIDRVMNYEPATGGAEAETIDALMERVPRQIRHRNRAVTVEDFEDLAMEASPEVMRAKCLPLLNLENPDAPETPGELSVIIVPRSLEAKPVPSLELVDRVKAYLVARADPTINLHVVGPEYVIVDVEIELVPTSLDLWSGVKQITEQELSSFLHPLTGGFEKKGWSFGRFPYKSDLYALLGSIPGVDYVHSLNVKSDPDLDYTKREEVSEETISEDLRKRFLVYSGKHEINLRLPQPEEEL